MPNPLRTEAERIVDDAIQLVVVQTPAKSPNEPWESFVENLRAQLYISVELALTRVQQAQRERDAEIALKYGAASNYFDAGKYIATAIAVRITGP